MKLIENKFLSSREWDLQRELSALTPILRAIYINLRTYLIKKNNLIKNVLVHCQCPVTLTFFSF